MKNKALPFFYVFLSSLVLVAVVNAMYFKHSYKLGPNQDIHFGSDSRTNSGNDVHEWEIKTSKHAALQVGCSYTLPMTINCFESYLKIITNLREEIYCGQGFASSDYSNSSISVIYKTRGAVMTPTTESVTCSANSNMEPYNDLLPTIKLMSVLGNGADASRTLQLGCQCGWTNPSLPANRLVGGETYGRHMYPFIVQLLRPSSQNQPYCAGTIISPDFVLTAGHCVVRNSRTGETLWVTAGTWDTRFRYVDYATQVRTVRKVILHEGFLKANNGILNDIALLMMDAPFIFTAFVGPACMPGYGWDMTGHVIEVLGWGSEGFHQPMMRIPERVEMMVLNKFECASEWTIFFSNPSEKMCTEAPRRSTCQGDSGGPVIWFSPGTNRFVLVGIVSFGERCSSTKPSVHTAVAAHLYWIIQWIDYLHSTTGSVQQLCMDRLWTAPV